MRLFIFAATILASLFGGVHLATADAAPLHDHCKVEDGSGQRICIWDARNMGNGEGHSLLIIRGGTDNAQYIRISHDRAYRLTH